MSFNLLYGNGNYEYRLVILNNTLRCRGLFMTLNTKSVFSFLCNIWRAFSAKQTRIRLLRRTEYYLGFAYLSVCNVHQLVVLYTKHGLLLLLLLLFLLLLLLLLLLPRIIMYDPYIQFSALTHDGGSASRKSSTTGAHTVSTFVHGFSVRHRSIQAVQVSRRLNLPVCGRYYTHRLLLGFN